MIRKQDSISHGDSSDLASNLYAAIRSAGHACQGSRPQLVTEGILVAWEVNARLPTPQCNSYCVAILVLRALCQGYTDGMLC